MPASAHEIIDRSVSIPSLPTIVTKINDLLEAPDSSARDIGVVVSEDPPIASRVLRIVNSAHYGLRERVISLDHACAVLGMRVLRNTVMQAALVQQYDGIAADSELQLEELGRHSILTAQVAQIAGRLATVDVGLSPDELYSCGLLHDIGKVAMLTSLGADYEAALRSARTEGRPLHEVEEETLGFSHADVGARIAIRWGLPGGVVSAIQYHHGPEEELESDPGVGLVAWVNELCDAVAAGTEELAASAEEARLASFGVDAEGAQRVFEEARQALGQIEI